MISASAQTKAASAGRQIPTNRQAKMTDAMQQQLGNLDDLVKKVNTVDWDVINANRPQWDARWNRQVER
jgi:putative spermidine/putrescine transport system substrate-binding protein